MVGLFAAMNYRLKGLDPLLHSVKACSPGPSIAGSRRRSAWSSPAIRTRAVMKGWPQALGIRDHVRFVGHCAEMRNAYFAADFLVHPTFYDPCSLVVLEALACGLPVITTAPTGPASLLKPLSEGYVIDDSSRSRAPGLVHGADARHQRAPRLFAGRPHAPPRRGPLSITIANCSNVFKEASRRKKAA